MTWNIDPATGALMSKVYPDSTATSYTYNARGQVKTRTWARTPTITTTYNYFDSSSNLTGELASVDYSDSTPDVSYTYTRFGAFDTVTDAAGTRSFDYRSDLKPEDETLGTFYGGKILTFNYHADGRPTGWSFNSSPSISSSVGLSAASGRPLNVTGTSGATSVAFSFSYTDGTNWIHQVTSGSYKRVTPLRSASGAKHNVISSATTSWGTTTLGSFTAAYADTRGWRSGQTVNTSSYATGLSLGGVAATYTYNGYGELTGSNSTLNTRDLTWTYDRAGNRLTEVDPTGTTNYTPDSLNQYASITGQRQEPGYDYDADGNLKQDAIWTYSYDAENRLKTLTKSGQTITFEYDYMGRRIRKAVTGTGAYDVKFLWNGWTMIGELASNGTTANKTFVWGQDFSDAQGSAGGAGALLAQIAGSTVSYAIPDALGNIVAYANSSGSIVASVEYSPYGKGLNATGSWQSFPIGFSGQYMDWEPGIVYYGYRYYAPKHGRFINRDPIEEAGGNNLYNFVGNGPTRSWDVLGLRWLTVITGYKTDCRMVLDNGVLWTGLRWVYKCTSTDEAIYSYIWIENDGSSSGQLYPTPHRPSRDTTATRPNTNTPTQGGPSAEQNGPSTGPAPNNTEKCKELAAQRDRLRSQLNAGRDAISNANSAMSADANGAVVGSTLDQVNQLAARVDASSRGMDVVLTAASEMDLRTIGRGLDHFSSGFSSITIGAGFGFGISDIQNGNYMDGASQIVGSSLGTASLIGGRLAADGVISKAAGSAVRVGGLTAAGAQVALFFGQELYAGVSHRNSLNMQQATIERFQARVDQQLGQLRGVYDQMKANGCN